jgi:hypothetical protein
MQNTNLKFRLPWLKLFFLLGGLVLLFPLNRCARQAPTETDGSLSLRLIVADQSGLIPVKESLGYAPVAGAKAELKSRNYYESPSTPKTYHAVSDSDGVVLFSGLPLGEYTLTVQKTVPIVDPKGDEDSITVRGNKIVSLFEPAVTDTVKAKLASKSALVINEIYYAGPKNNAYYFYDQFVELYNSADTTVYLDGLILCRGRGYHNPKMDSLDYVQVIYVYQFPGVPKTGRDYPVAPHQFVVIAQDAIDHSQFIKTALDLSNADWEFYNPYYSEIDNPAPNVVNAIPDNSTDFMINLVHDFVILADGSDYYPGEVSEYGYQYYHVPIRTVLDGVEYSANPNKLKELTNQVDAGFAGVGISKYSGKSTERRRPGFDTNNSSLDFIVLDHPTPGYSHE